MERRGKRICILATGGTIASVPGPKGLRPGLTGEGILALLPGAAELAETDCVELMALDSTNLLPGHWQRMAEAVWERREAYDGFVITHGTDTMAYSAGALSLMLEHVDCPVVFTGAQLPMEAAGSDAAGNLLSALHGAVSGRPGVYLAFGGMLHHGGAVRKMYSRSPIGFCSIQCPPVAEFTGERLIWRQPPQNPGGDFRLATDLDERVAVLKLVPGTDPELLKLMVDAGYHGILVEGYGAGGVPNGASSKDFLPALAYAVENNVSIVCTTQCVYDGAYLDTYEVGIRAMEMGAVSGGRLHLELLFPAVMLALAKSRERGNLARYLADVEGRLLQM